MCDLKMIAERLRLARKNNSRKYVADKIGVHVSTYGLYERGIRAPDVLFVSKFCDTLNINPTWLLTGQGPMDMPDNPGLDTELLKKIIASVEKRLDDLNWVVSPEKKAEIISFLYDEALERDDWREELGLDLDRKTKRLISLIANQNGGVSIENQSYNERLKYVIHESVFSDMNNVINDQLQKAQKSNECIDLNEKMIEMLQDRIETQQVERDKIEGKYLSYIVGCLAFFIMAVLSARMLGKTSPVIVLILFLLFLLLGLWTGSRAAQLKLQLHRFDHAINSATDLVIGLIKEKIMAETKKQARKEANQELRS